MHSTQRFLHEHNQNKRKTKRKEFTPLHNSPENLLGKTNFIIAIYATKNVEDTNYVR